MWSQTVELLNLIHNAWKGEKQSPSRPMDFLPPDLAAQLTTDH
jgi:hypothetical protein